MTAVYALVLLTTLAVALAAPAAICAIRIARLHRRFGPAAWPFIVSADKGQACLMSE